MSDSWAKKMAQKLGALPCPFCGGTPKVYLLGTSVGAIKCSECGATTKMSHGGHYLKLTTTVKLWNSRVNGDKETGETQNNSTERRKSQ